MMDDHWGSSTQSLRDLLDRARTLAATRLPLILQGEQGTGKRRLAREIHLQSGRKGAFVVLDCRSHDEMASEPAGTDERPGVFERAHRGTLLLHEVGCAPRDFQIRLLRPLDSARARRPGDGGDHPFDVRVMATTSDDLWQHVCFGSFRADLYHRLKGDLLAVPPLRDRRRDIPALARMFLARAAARHRVIPPELSRDVALQLLGAQWLGNLRELESSMEQLVLRYHGRVIERVQFQPPKSQPPAEDDLAAARLLADDESQPDAGE